MYQQQNIPDVPMCIIDQIKGNSGEINFNQGALSFDRNQMESDSSGIDSDDYLVDDIFLVNELNSSFPKSVDDSSPFSSTDDELMQLIKTATDERKPFESFEKQITVTVINISISHFLIKNFTISN